MSGAKRQKTAHDAPAKRQKAEASASQASPDPPTEEESATLDVASSADAADAPEEPKTFKELVRDKTWLK
jgi:ATP-dependent RNA helicase DDX47/RRP3